MRISNAIPILCGTTYHDRHDRMENQDDKNQIWFSKCIANILLQQHNFCSSANAFIFLHKPDCIVEVAQEDMKLPHMEASSSASFNCQQSKLIATALVYPRKSGLIGSRWLVIVCAIRAWQVENLILRQLAHGVASHGGKQSHQLRSDTGLN